ncbi:MAG TPA: penicillin-binding protein 2 [Actinobacteria bacterium]|nr:penicillin-binding protein 2 [Actinomycetota bacterium]
MNGPMRRVAVALFVIFAVLVVAVTYWQVFAADRLRSDPRNSRELISRIGRERGLILSADNIVLARSVPDPADPQSFLREYPQGDIYAHTVGYSSFLFGDTGVERIRAQDLTSGRDLTVSGIIQALLGGDEPAESVQLTLNDALQRVAADALGTQAGAVVAIDPATGAVLAMVSSPSFDPNLLVGDSAQTAMETLREDPDQPLLSRAISESYAPGSTFKTIVASAAIETGGAGPETIFPNPSELELPLSTATIQNYRGVLCGSGDTVTLEIAFLRSCNVTFALLGMNLGEEAVIGQAEQYGFNRDTPFDLPVLNSAVPTPDDLNGDLAALAQNSLGERDVQATAFQMALVATAIANDGRLMEPFLVAKGFNADSTLRWEREPEFLSQPIGAGTAQILGEMMERVVTQGTGTRAQIPGIRVAGKTGTAEVGGGPPHAWFVGFAPVGNPRIAIAVVVADGGDVGENATGGVVAAPIARTVIDYWLSTGQ